MLLLVTGATGKAGSALITRVLRDPEWQAAKVGARCHNRALPETSRLQVVHGPLANRADVERAMAGVTHVIHLATCKEIPQTVMDVTVKG